MNTQTNYDLSKEKMTMLSKRPNTNNPHANLYFAAGIFFAAIGISVFIGILYYGIINL